MPQWPPTKGVAASRLKEGVGDRLVIEIEFATVLHNGQSQLMRSYRDSLVHASIDRTADPADRIVDEALEVEAAGFR
jgi:hypothetical protein